ncbi:MAG: hypothetical protein M5U22_20120 [Thermoleophilia bacterium]|nr:hypothetical protein [Thermoleophilia bacterium]
MLSVGWFSLLMFPLLSGFFGCTLIAALERSRRLAVVASVLLVAVLSAVLFYEHSLLGATGGG